ncbi:enoyl-CoA hydratase/isomerase family protein [Variovorax sp. J22R133]|uniref:enoyl-CoA hydratase/isomerase family protein n=1 Tax=Variovorax brevis TaxID=3053503 RepID=UPI002577C2C3|nr:enoyl-CoA hydratase/isomerase family protein [Variovorax sp. J22R133]MDM0114760.1 enoyl-CoA hydratase/isomerase family protein [Variovorax sp. J22R133]
MGEILSSREGAVLTLQLSNPGKANALDLAMLAQLDQHLKQVEQDTTVRAVVLRGQPGGVFSSGADIAQWAPMTPSQFAEEWIRYGNRVFARLEQLRCPTVAAVEGLCFGGGFELALAADLRVASDAARLHFPEVAIGAMPGWEGGNRLERIVGRGRALEAVLTCRQLDAATGLQWGALNAVWPARVFEAGLTEFVATLTRVSPVAARWAKAAIVRGNDPAAADGGFYAEAGHAVKASADAAIGIAAFKAKTTAIF